MLLNKKGIKLAIFLVFSMAIAIFVLQWAQEDSPIFRPLIQDMRLVDSVKIADVLDQEEIRYYSDVKNHMLYVDIAKTELARISLAKHGFVIDYPEITKHQDLNKAYEEFIKLERQKEVYGELWERPEFLPLLKLLMGALTVIVLILTVMRPALKAILNEEDG
ncbi:hypothetical protein [Alteromonas sp. KUL49]|uniref:hypothetical protein n=1 Tax=Alteromonas sp. KUL49 TaxID=2480798 RepID=UPI00102EE66A|nr:hypothetical protein [Alteromonas sp. KUL49]TAP40705.1 hypothetical protein EYS00_06200 [Alteromonas sp. KUL49]GEA10874.1 hypothetical protein KUL49_12490 [Alteromonas sp. KUL49]